MIREEWLSYQSEVLPHQAGPVQIRETRRAFYAGALALFNMLANDPNSENEQFIAALGKEFTDYRDDIEKGTN